MFDLEQVKRDAVGRWPGILEAIGIDTYGGKHGPCPICGGTDRFRFDDQGGNGGYICGQCGAGDGFALVQKTCGMDFKSAVTRVGELCGTVESRPVAFDENMDVIKNRLNTLWKSSIPLSDDGIVASYLRGRGISHTPKNIRYNPEAYEPETKRKLPAMIAMVSDREGKPVTLHRTFLEIGKSGHKSVSKAAITTPKRLVTGIKKLAGSAVRLFDESACIGLAEGIETALSAAKIFNIPTWAVLSSSLMKSWEPPESVTEIVIFGDNDKNYAGQNAAYELANRLARTRKVDVSIPDSVGDWNDVLVREVL